MSPEPPFLSPASTQGKFPFLKQDGVIILVAFIAALIKTGIALMTLGTNDSIGFYQFAKALENPSPDLDVRKQRSF